MALVQKSFSEIITFSRASNATRFAPDGTLQYAPHNLLTYSEQFDNASGWTSTRASVSANATTAPTGTSVADKIVEDTTASNTHLTFSANVSVSTATVYTYSVYAKAAGRTWFNMQIGTGVGAYGANVPFCYFNLSGAGAVGASGFGTGSITDVGNGWYRCVVVATATTSASTTNMRIKLASANSTDSYTGDGTSGIFVWGAQLAVGPYPLDYTPTTTAVVYGPRFDYNPTTLAPLGLLIEEQRTNLVTYSEQFDNAAWTKQSSVTVSANTTVAPDGTTSGDTVTADSGLSIYQSVAATIGTTYCQSVFIKAGTATSILLRDDTGAGRSITINPSTGAITATSGTLVTSGSQAIQNGWWRYWFAYVADAATVRALIRPFSAGAAQTFIVWGAQTEAGAFPTSYIPTVASTVTRSADVASVNTLSPWYNAAEGTLFAEYARYANVAGRIATISNNTANNQIRLNCSVAAAIRPDWQIIDANVVQANVLAVNTIAPNVVAKSAGAYAVNSFNQATNAVLGVEDTSGTVPSVSQLNIGANEAGGSIINGHIRRIAYYNRRLTNAELQVLTS